MQTKTKLSYNICKHINQRYFPKYGHTTIMLNKMFEVLTTLKEYNEYVFEINQIQKLKIDKETYKHDVMKMKLIGIFLHF